MSCKAISTPAFPNITPVVPPRVNVIINYIDNNDELIDSCISDEE